MQYPLTFLLARLRDGKRFPAPRETWHLINRIGSKLGVDGLGDSRLCSIEAEEKERSSSLKVRMKRKEQRRRGYNLAWESIWTRESRVNSFTSYWQGVCPAKGRSSFFIARINGKDPPQIWFRARASGSWNWLKKGTLLQLHLPPKQSFTIYW